MLNPTRNRYRNEPAFDEVVAAHPDFPRLIALKIDVQRRGVLYTESAFRAVDPERHQLYTWGGVHYPHSLLLRDGTTVLANPQPEERDPYRVEYSEGRFVLVDEGEIIEEVEIWPRPRYYDKKTSSGLLMKEVVSARPQRLDIFASAFCHFAHAEDNGCKFCPLPAHHRQLRETYDLPTRLRAHDVKECIAEALKEPGRFTNIHITGGSVVKGKEILDAELSYYIDLLKHIGELFSTPRFPSQLLATAYNEKQLARLREETGLGSFTADIEVLNEEKFNWICPGKAHWIGYREWKRRLVDAVGVFGRGNVGTGIVGGVETAPPHGFTSERDALEATLSEAEDLAEKGVTTVHTVWVPQKGSEFHELKAPSLDYFIRLAKGLQGLRVKHGLSVDFDDYRRCGNHPDSDLARLQ
ncbi:radical SAM protein [Rhodomicrobium sp.]|uniref:radical SAM protein n=1 Tax=Rhodomicrobium sp. TaxID=2720632 RepID=UPI0039E697FA